MDRNLVCLFALMQAANIGLRLLAYLQQQPNPAIEKYEQYSLSIVLHVRLKAEHINRVTID